MSRTAATLSGWLWTAAAAAASFATSAVLSGALQWSRAAFIGGWLVVGGTVSFAYVRGTGITPGRQLQRRWIGGLVIGVATGAVLALTVLRHPGSPAPTGGSLLGELLWSGVVYGVVDAVMLTILPVLALYGARPAGDLSDGGARARWAAVALAGSLLVTAAYHLGFREFQGPGLVQPLIGNAVVTLAYLLSGSLLAPLIAHVMMHLVAVLHGAATTVQLPPHY